MLFVALLVQSPSLGSLPDTRRPRSVTGVVLEELGLTSSSVKRGSDEFPRISILEKTAWNTVLFSFGAISSFYHTSKRNSSTH